MMATQEPTSDITARDVLQQVDRRLELLEGDVRSLDTKVGLGFSEQRSYVDSGFGELRKSIEDTRDRLETRMDARFRWTIGLILMSWMTTMGAILFRLGPLVQ